MDSMTVSMFRSLKNQAIRERYNEIYAHELAHKNAAGSLAGPIVIEKDADGIPVGGHVSIKIPSIDPNNPQKTIDQADVVIKSALAPSDPSAQDYKAASEARNIKAKAQQIQSTKRLDYYA